MRSGVCVVSSAEQFRENAEECLGWAKTARTAKERDIFLQIARAWEDAAVRALKRADIENLNAAK